MPQFATWIGPWKWEMSEAGYEHSHIMQDMKVNEKVSYLQFATLNTGSKVNIYFIYIKHKTNKWEYSSYDISNSFSCRM